MRLLHQITRRTEGWFQRATMAHFPACVAVNSLLITSLRAAECTASRNPVGSFYALPHLALFRPRQRNGAVFWVRAESISWGAVQPNPNRDDSFDPMVMQAENQTKNLPGRFLRENAGAKTANHYLN
jgi:hypothetical protein